MIKKLSSCKFAGQNARSEFAAWYGGGDIICELRLYRRGSKQFAKIDSFALDAANVTMGELLGSLALIDVVEIAKEHGIVLRDTEKARRPFSDLVSTIAAEKDFMAATPAYAAEDILRAAL